MNPSLAKAMRRGRNASAFTLMELLVVIFIIGLLTGILLPTLSAARARANKVACMANLRQVGIGIQAYVDGNKDHYPAARYMPPPFLSVDENPPLNKYLDFYLVHADQGKGREVYRCPSDKTVFDLSGMSYMYQAEQGGSKLSEFFLVKYFNLPTSEIMISRDFDGGTFDVESGQVTVDTFHRLRNLLFADGHVGNFSGEY